MLTVNGVSPQDDAIEEGSTCIVLGAGERRLAIICSRVVATEAVVRDTPHRRTVFSRTLGRDIPFVFPPALLAKGN
jgi:hypothetical protein